MNDNDFFTVIRREVHALDVCPCELCVAERERRKRILEIPTGSRVRRIPFGVAKVLGIVRRTSPQGSVARGLMTNGQDRP